MLFTMLILGFIGFVIVSHGVRVTPSAHGSDSSRAVDFMAHVVPLTDLQIYPWHSQFHRLLSSVQLQQILSLLIGHAYRRCCYVSGLPSQWSQPGPAPLMIDLFANYTITRTIHHRPTGPGGSLTRYTLSRS